MLEAKFKCNTSHTSAGQGSRLKCFTVILIVIYRFQNISITKNNTRFTALVIYIPYPFCVFPTSFLSLHNDNIHTLKSLKVPEASNPEWMLPCINMK